MYTYQMIATVLVGAAVAFGAVNWIYFKTLTIAFRKKLVDNPNARKLQKRPVPVVGGIAVFFGLLAGLLAASVCHHVLMPDLPHISLFPVLCAMGIMLYVGTMDDIVGLSPLSRIVIEVVSILAIIFGSGMCVDTFRGMWGVEAFSWWLAVPLTVFAGVGIINAINMIDGVNGLSSGLCIICSILFGVAFIRLRDVPNAVLAFTMAAAVIPFYIHNVFGLKSRMFIGDAGTMVMGILMTWFLICLLSSRNDEAYYEVDDRVNLIAMSLAILSVPVFDTLRVMTMRALKGKSPFRPDKTHLHHVFVNVGVSHFITGFVEVSLGLAITGIWGVSVLCGAGLELQLYIVIIASVLGVWGTYVFLRHHIIHHTEFLHKITGFSVRTHLGRTEWWKAITSWLDAPGDYSDAGFPEPQPASQSPDGVQKDCNEGSLKEQDRKRILEYMKGKAEVHVDDLLENSGAERLRVYPILTEEVQTGSVVVVKSTGWGAPEIVALRSEV
mgnify:FL=1